MWRSEEISTRDYNDAAVREGGPLPLPVKPTHIELAAFTALLQTYGPAVFNHC
jgi:hypothetical protein